jgi:hypothetical protein
MKQRMEINLKRPNPDFSWLKNWKDPKIPTE